MVLRRSPTCCWRLVLRLRLRSLLARVVSELHQIEGDEPVERQRETAVIEKPRKNEVGWETPGPSGFGRRSGSRRAAEFRVVTITVTLL